MKQRGNSMSTTKKPAKTPEDLQATLQALIAQGRKEGMIRASDLNAQLEKLDLSPEKIEEIYDQFEAMNIQVVSADLDLDLGDDADMGLGDLGDLRASHDIPDDTGIQVHHHGFQKELRQALSAC